MQQSVHRGDGTSLQHQEEGTREGMQIGDYKNVHVHKKETANQETLKSGMTDHCRRHNHIMDRDRGKVVILETNKLNQWIKVAIEISGARVGG